MGYMIKRILHLWSFLYEIYKTLRRLASQISYEMTTHVRSSINDIDMPLPVDENF